MSRPPPPVPALAPELAALAAETDPALAATVHAILERLRMLQLVEAGPQPGDMLPDLELPDATGRVWRSEELLARGPLVLALFRGPWCPYCERTMRALEAIRPAIEARGATLVGIVPTRPELVARMAEERGLRFPILTDRGLRWTRLLGLAYAMSDEHRALYAARGVDVAAQQAGAGWELPVPASFVVRRDGTIAWAFADPDWARRAEPAELLAELDRAAADPAGQAEAAEPGRAAGSP